MLKMIISPPRSEFEETSLLSGSEAGNFKIKDLSPAFLISIIQVFTASSEVNFSKFLLVCQLLSVLYSLFIRVN